MPAAPADGTAADRPEPHSEDPAEPKGAGPGSWARTMPDAWPLDAGAGVTLRPARFDDAPALHATWVLPRSQEYTDRAVSSLADTLTHLRLRLEDDDSLVCVIEHDEDVIGDIGVTFRSPHSLARPSRVRDAGLGYGIHPDRWGRGIATAAVRAFTAFLHDRLAVRRVVAMVFSENAASLRVLQRGGYRLEGTERAAVLGRDGRWLDDCTLAHLPEDPIPSS